jgi:hypothetical protein
MKKALSAALIAATAIVGTATAASAVPVPPESFDVLGTNLHCTAGHVSGYVWAMVDKYNFPRGTVPWTITGVTTNSPTVAVTSLTAPTVFGGVPWSLQPVSLPYTLYGYTHAGRIADRPGIELVANLDGTTKLSSFTVTFHGTWTSRQNGTVRQANRSATISCS